MKDGTHASPYLDTANWTYFGTDLWGETVGHINRCIYSLNVPRVISIFVYINIIYPHEVKNHPDFTHRDYC